MEKEYLVCYACIFELSQTWKEDNSLETKMLKMHCNNNPKCFMIDDQPERSKREDLKCENCKGIPFVFNCCWGDPRHLGNENCDEYNFRMRCSEHCRNAVREVQ